MDFRRFFPFLQWLPGYRKTLLQGDLAAGLTVGVMLIPQGMAYAMIAGMPPIYGLYAATVPLILYALLGTSRQLAVGPVAMVSLLTAAGVGSLAEAGTQTYIALAISLAFMVGLIQLLLGLFRLGFLVNFLSHPVVSGFTAAAALIIGFSQLRHLFGLNLPQTQRAYEVLYHIGLQWREIQLPTLLLGLSGLAIILVSRRIHKKIPGALLAVVAGIAVTTLFSLEAYGVKVLGEVPAGLPHLVWSVPEWTQFRALLPVALAISLVSFMESIAVAKAMQARHKDHRLDPDQELIALGSANLGGSFLQSFPVTGGFSRTAVNDQAGARTGMASIVSAGLILLTLLFLTPLFRMLPNAILAAVILVAVAGLLDVHEARRLWHTDRSDFWMLLVTFLGTLTLGIEEGIGLGVILSLVMVVFRVTKPHIAILGRVPGTRFYRNINRFKDLEIRPDVLIARPDAQLFFANIQYFHDTMEEQIAKKGKALKCVIINGESISHIDSSAAAFLRDWIIDLRSRGLEIYFHSIIGPVRDKLACCHLLELIGADHIFMSVQDAVEAWTEACQCENPDRKVNTYAIQVNEK